MQSSGRIAKAAMAASQKLRLLPVWLRTILVVVALILGLEVASAGLLRLVAAGHRAAFVEQTRPTWDQMSIRGLYREDERQYWHESRAIQNGTSYGYLSRYSLLGGYRGKFIQTDDRGFRFVPDAGNPRAPLVGFFGGSVVWGYSTETNAITLAAAFQRLSGGKLRAANYGVLGYSSVESTVNLLSAIMRDHPKDPFSAVVLFGVWNDCGHSTFWWEAGAGRPAPYVSDGMPVESNPPLELFQRELEKAGKFVIDIALVWERLKKRAQQQWDRDSIVRLVRALTDRDYNPWMGQPATRAPNQGQRPKTDVEIRTALKPAIEIYENNVEIFRAMGDKYGFKVFAVLGPMAFHKKNPPNDGHVPLENWRILRSCYAMIQDRLRGKPHFIDLTGVEMPDRQVFDDVGHMVGAGNEVVARALIERIGPALDTIESTKSEPRN